MLASPFDYPEDHKFGMKVPKGGSSCAKCEYLTSSQERCSNPYFKKANDDSAVLPEPADEFCCDVFEAKK